MEKIKINVELDIEDAYKNLHPSEQISFIENHINQISTLVLIEEIEKRGYEIDIAETQENDMEIL